ncbi:crotonase/enoyl-CoA hydratase family protein [Rhodobacterales bacterium HKCCE2091]|nr:crotonase/enoyl-CoA hydratase family protein [Rhodobacterales bacterium HKCCE2091]
MTGDVLLTERRGPVLILTMNRPAAHNAISPELACRLADAFIAFETDAEAMVCILTGAGSATFSSGGDLALTLPLLTGDRVPETEWDRRFLDDPAVLEASSLRRLTLDKPVIAAVNGHCLAGGFETLLGTDIRVASETARFGLPEVRHGLIPFAGAPTRLPREIPRALAAELLLTGDSIDAAAALAAGLVNHVVPPAEVLPKALAIAERIAANGPLAVRSIKRMGRDAVGAGLAEGFAVEYAEREIIMATKDAREGPRAFMEKRKPVFGGH